MIQHVLVRLLADGTLIAVVAIAGYALTVHVPKSQRIEVYCRVLMAGLTAYLFAKLIGSVFQPVGERPFQAMGTAAGALYLQNGGFPSDHALFASFLTLAVWFETRRKRLALVLAVLTVLMGIGRVLALVHTPLDIIGGVGIAFIGALWLVQKAPQRLPHKVLVKKTKT
jgi:membrane-associated phospholipid phosphatase